MRSGSARTSTSGLPRGDHLSTQKNCSPERERSFGPRNADIEENAEGNLGMPMCGVAKVLKFTGCTVSKNFDW